MSLSGGHLDDRDFGEFFRYITRHDKFRIESFIGTFPEFYEVIEKYKPEDVVMEVVA